MREKIVKNIAKEQTLNILAKLTGANSNITEIKRIAFLSRYL